MTQAKMRIKTGDTVMVRAGKDKGRSGKVLRAMPADQKVIVEGINVAARHTKPSQANPHGGIIRKEMPMHVCKVGLLDASTGQATRIAYQTQGDKKVRIAKKSGETVANNTKKAGA